MPIGMQSVKSRHSQIRGLGLALRADSVLQCGVVPERKVVGDHQPVG